MKMNPILELAQWVEDNHTNAQPIVSPPLLVWGVWTLDVGALLCVEWSEATKFGVCITRPDDYGQGPDAVYETIDEVKEWLTTNLQETPS